MAATKKRKQRHHTLRSDHLQAIGLLIAEWASAEYFFADVLARLIVEPDGDKAITNRTFIVTLGMDARVKLGLMKTIARVRFPDHADSFDRLIDQILSIKTQRDLVAHTPWRAGTKPGLIEPYGLKTVGKLKNLSGQRSAEQISDLAWSLREKIEYMAAFLTMNGVVIAISARLLQELPPEQAPLRRKLMRVLRQETAPPPKPHKRLRPPRSPRPK